MKLDDEPKEWEGLEALAKRIYEIIAEGEANGLSVIEAHDRAMQYAKRANERFERDRP